MLGFIVVSIVIKMGTQNCTSDYKLYYCYPSLVPERRVFWLLNKLCGSQHQHFRISASDSGVLPISVCFGLSATWH